MIITLEVINDVYSKPNGQGIQKLIKKDVISKKQFESTQILVEQFIGSRGTPSKKYCLIKNGEEYFKLNHKFEEIEKLTKPMEFKGYRYGKNSKKF